MSARLSSDTAMPDASAWRCPHCQTVQPESAHCRACQRPAITCSSCHLFRGSVAADVGYCADDRRRTPLSGHETRSCWEAEPAPEFAMGLFDSLETTPTQPMQAAQPAPPPERVPTTARPRTATGSVRDPAGSTLPSGLVEAPRVAPGRQVTSEIQRRTRRQTED